MQLRNEGLLDEPLESNKAELEKLLQWLPESSRIRYSEHLSKAALRSSDIRRGLPPRQRS